STRSSGRLSISSGIVNVCGSNSPCAMKPAGTSSHLSPAHGVCPSQEKCVASDRGTATATPNAAAAARAPAASRCSLIPGKALLEAIVDQFGHGAPNLIHPYLIEAGHTSRTRQLVVKVVLKAHKDLDAIADDSLSRIVSETESIVHLARWQGDAREGGKVQNRAQFDPPRVHRDRPVRNELVSRHGDTERRIPYDEVPELPLDLLGDVD